MKATYLFNSLLIALLGLITACGKTDFLNEKPQKSLLIPNTLEHYQRILDEDGMMNGVTTNGLTPQLGESSSDNFYLLETEFNTYLNQQKQGYYIWSENPYGINSVLDWEFPYRAILYANTVLDGVSHIERTEQNSIQHNNIIGQALFHRAHMFHQLSQVFAPAYNPDSDNSALGIILRSEADINESLRRATVQETYDQIINDLTTSISLLDETPLHKARPSKQAAYGLLARVYLTMGEYSLAKLYSDSCLQIQGDLLDFNNVNANLASPFQGTRFEHPINREIIFFSVMLSEISEFYPINPYTARVDTSLYLSYHADDLRRKLFFDPFPPIGYRFKGSYSFRGFNHYFSGLAVDEILLIRSECNARLGNVEDALIDLNRLLIARWDIASVYIPYEGLNEQDALSVILKERRKELVFRGLRWPDLRRLNQEGHNIALTRNINGEIYTLTPNDQRWVWPLPLEVSSR